MPVHIEHGYLNACHKESVVVEIALIGGKRIAGTIASYDDSCIEMVTSEPGTILVYKSSISSICLQWNPEGYHFKYLDELHPLYRFLPPKERV